MQIREVMTREVEVVGPDTPLQQAAQSMKRLDVGSLPVCDGDKLRGWITDRDITIRATAEGRDPRETKVRDVMTEKVRWCTEDQSAAEVAGIMEKDQIRRLPVIDEAKKLVGIVSLGDLATRCGPGPMAGKALEGVSQPTTSHARR